MFLDEAMEVGFTKEQAEFLEERLALNPHGHDMSDIDGLEEALADEEEISEDDD